MADFYQQGPVLGNQYRRDVVLCESLQRYLPKDVLAEIEPDLVQWGERVVGDVAAIARKAESQEPKLVQYDPWGRRIDCIEVSDAWRQLDAVSAQEGLVAIAYEREYSELSRLYQLAKLYLFDPSSAVYTCPLAMTDGATRIVEVHGDEYLMGEVFWRLTSRNPSEFWTSGQWMTERTGGSDVSRTQTIARKDGEQYRLYGTKWFTSATTSQMAMTLAQVEGAENSLSLFYLETRDANGCLNGISINRLKDKLGTRAVPTAELSLHGAPARLIGEAGAGVKTISALLNITRIYNSICAVSKMRRGLALAEDYAQRRQAFGKTLSQHSLHRETLTRLRVEFEGAFHLVFYVAALLGKEECRQATPQEQAMLRILTPIAKLYTAKQCVAVISEVLECFGGAGYVEDTGLPVLLRDAQVLPIWEGTTNILSLDVLRAMFKSNALNPLLSDAMNRLAKVSHPQLTAELPRVQEAIQKLFHFAGISKDMGAHWLRLSARDFAYSLARTYTAALLLEHAQWAVKRENPRPVAIARRWCRQDLTPLPTMEDPDLYCGEFDGFNRKE